MIDLHIHTNFSDGTDNYIDVLKKAEKQQLTCISITDHDNCKVYQELEKINQKDYYSGKIVKGIEIKTKIDKIAIELLGYGINTKIMENEIHKISPDNEKKNIEEANQLVSVCRKIGLKLEDDILDNYHKEEWVYASEYIHKQIKKYENNQKFFSNEKSWQNDKVFYRKEMTNPSSPFYIDNTDKLPTVDEVIELIHQAGGFVFIPHVYNYGENSNRIFEHLMKNDLIDGIECYYSKYTEEQTKFLIEYANTHQLYMSGGSDYHGKYKPKIELGIGRGSLKVPEKIIEPWIYKI